MALASIADYEAITGQSLGVADSARIERLLVLAESAVLAGAHGQLIVEDTYTDVVMYPVDGVVAFPQRPVTAVAAVEVNGVALVAGEWRFTAGGNRQQAMLIRRSGGVDVPWTYDVTSIDGAPVSQAPEVTVTYTAGWATIPGQIVAIVCSMVKGAVDNDGSAAAASGTDSAGPFTQSRTYDADTVQAPTMALTRSARSVLASLCGVQGGASLPVTVG